MKTTLFEKLQKTEKLLTEAKITTMAEKEKADLEKIKKEKEEYQSFVNSIKDQIIENIENEKVPVIKIKDYNKRKWINEAKEGKAKYNSLWSEMVRYFKDERLSIIVNDAHDGMGMEEWTTITVELIYNGYRNQHGLKADLDVGEYRG
jgi:hypothetical protein